MICVTDQAKCGRGRYSHDWLWRVSLLDGKAQLVGCLIEPEGILLEFVALVDMMSVSIITPDWYAVTNLASHSIIALQN